MHYLLWLENTSHDYSLCFSTKTHKYHDFSRKKAVLFMCFLLNRDVECNLVEKIAFTLVLGNILRQFMLVFSTKLVYIFVFSRKTLRF